MRNSGRKCHILSIKSYIWTGTGKFQVNKIFTRHRFFHCIELFCYNMILSPAFVICFSFILFFRVFTLISVLLLQIEWLLQDEIVCNLRHLSPIRTDALSYIAKHIQSSHSIGKANVCVDTVPLQFVFGTDQSHDKFTEVK